MLPLIIISQNENQATKFSEDFASEHGYKSTDILTLQPDKSEFTIGQIREIQAIIRLATARPRLFLLYSFDHANLEAQNAFLKTLEEQSHSNQFILFVRQPDKLLPTIISRSKVMKLSQQSQDSSINQEILDLIEKRDLKVLVHKNVTGLDRDQALSFCDELITALSKNMTLYAHKIKKIYEAKLYLEGNINVQLAIDNLLIALAV